jgi:hypothetical protein
MYLRLTTDSSFTNYSAMEANATPNVARNVCWNCTREIRLPARATACYICNTETAPTSDGTQTPLNYHVLSFGERADEIHTCERLRGTLLDEAIQLFRTRTLVAVRIGVGENIAIMIKDANGAIRRTINMRHVFSCAPRSQDSVTEFLNAAYVILLTEPDPDKGKDDFSTLTTHDKLKCPAKQETVN